MLEPPQNVLLYDSHCLLCDSSVRRLMAWLPAAQLGFAPLHGETAQAVRARHASVNDSLRCPAIDAVPNSEQFTTAILVLDFASANERVLFRSDAVLEIFRMGGKFWRLLAWLGACLPRGLRDLFYTIVARQRYRWFGPATHSLCEMPSPAQAARLLP